MKCWTDAIVCQLQSMAGIVAQDHWSIDELEAMYAALDEAAGNTRTAIALRLERRRRYARPDNGGAA